MCCLIHNCSLAKFPRRLKHVLGMVQAGGLKLWSGEHTRDQAGSRVSIRPMGIPPGGFSAALWGRRAPARLLKPRWSVALPGYPSNEHG